MPKDDAAKWLARAKECHGSVIRSARRTLAEALEAGKWLTMLYDHVRESVDQPWGKWLAERWPELGKRTDQQYRRLWANKDKIDQTAESTLDGVLRALGRTKGAKKRKAKKAQSLRVVGRAELRGELRDALGEGEAVVAIWPEGARTITAPTFHVGAGQKLVIVYESDVVQWWREELAEEAERLTRELSAETEEEAEARRIAEAEGE